MNCRTADGKVGKGVKSSEGPFGNWGAEKTCDCNCFFESVFMRSQPKQGGKDDTAVNNFDFVCDHGGGKVWGSGTPWGEWNLSECPKGSVICGLKTRVEGRQKGGDDTGLNEAEFYCCTAPTRPPCHVNVTTPDPLTWVPTFKFDRANKCYPTEASKALNGHCSKGFDANAPVYYEGYECEHNLYRLNYWLFYGWQSECVGVWGSHDNDWEHVNINFKKSDQHYIVDSIMYSQHSGWYTRQYSFPDERTHVDVYPGKIAHGNYYDTCCFNGCQSTCTEFPGIECLYFKDFRNPGISWTPLRLLPLQVAIDVGGLIGNNRAKICNQETCNTDGCEDNNWNFSI